ncbi:MAG: putative RND superfamily exporter protein [Bermanella sp.]
MVDLQKDINRSFHADDPQYYRLAENQNQISQYFFVYELFGGKEVYDFVSHDYAKAVVELRVSMTDSRNLKKLLGDIDGYLEQNPVPGTVVKKTGVGLMWVKMAEYISRTQIVGYSLIFLGVAVILCIAFGSIKVGMLAMIPNIAPVVVVLGAMTWLGMHLDYVKLLLATIAIGIGVDDTIHLMINLRRQFLKTGNYEKAVVLALKDVEPALLITTIILVGAFSCYLLSSMAIISSFGVLLSAAIVVALLADLLFMTALVLLTKPFGPEASKQ